MTPAQREALYLPATRALLDGWCGPVEVATPGGWVEAVTFGEDATAVFRVVAALDGGVGHRAPAGIRLDLSRAEVYDRVVRVLAAVLFGRGGPSALRPEWTSDPVEGWSLFLMDALLDEGADIVDMAVWDRAGEAAGATRAAVYALADIDPNDDTRLTDGSRLVDRLALAAVAREVLVAATPDGRS